MPKSMPKFALPRHHPKHPSGLHNVYETRKILNQQVEDAKGVLKGLHVSEKVFREAIESRLAWKRPVTTDPGTPVLRLIAAMQDEITLSCTNFCVYRHLQQVLNRQRKALQNEDIDQMSCRSRGRFMQEIFAFLSLIKTNIIDGFHIMSQALPESNKPIGTLRRREVLELWVKAGKVDRTELMQADKTLALLSDIRKATQFRDSVDSLRSFSAYMEECPSEVHRFEPTTYKTIMTQISLYIHMAECTEALGYGHLCFSCQDCQDMNCGLHGMTYRVLLRGELICEFNSDTYWDLLTGLFLPMYTQSGEITMRCPLLKAVTDEMKAEQKKNGIKDSVSLELVRLLESYQCPEMTARSMKALLSRIKLHERRGWRLDRLAKAFKCESHASGSPTCSTIKATSLSAPTALPAESPRAIDECAESPTDDEAVLDEIASDKLEPDEIELDELNPEEVVPVDTHNSLQASPRRGSPKHFRKAEKQKEQKMPVSAADQLKKTFQKYQERFDLKVSDDSTSLQLASTATRVWHMPDSKLYDEVWRVIFPRSRNDRQISRVSWPMFRKAMQAPPVNCRIKRDAYPMVVFERYNEDGGREIFECHGPHHGDWIPASDLYRYKKDLEATFGMAAERMFLVRDKAKNVVREHHCR